MNILIDMNLSPMWEQVLCTAGHQAIHWSRIGPPDAKDHELLAWARENGHVVFTHDLDFGAILAASQAEGPSVLQLRAQNVTPDHLRDRVLSTLGQVSDHLARGALISLDERSARIRILPLR